MRKNIFLNILGVFAILIALTSCDEQDVAAIISTDNYPTATFTTDFTGNQVVEGDIIKYTITLDRPCEHDLSFSLKTSGTADENDVTYPESVTIPAYETTADFVIEFTVDNIPEDETKTFSFELGEFELETRYFLKPTTVNPKMDLTLVSKNDPDALTVFVEWDNGDDDWDLMIIDEEGADEWTGWAGATGANPEITLLANTTADGTYYAELDPYDIVNSVVNFNISIGKPDQTNQFFTFTYEAENADTYPANWGVRIVKIVKVGDAYTCTMAE